MTYHDILKHGTALLFVFFVAFLVNGAFSFGSGIPPRYNQSSDATVHAVHWQEFSRTYSGSFKNDRMFQNFREVPTGVLLADKALVRTGELLNVNLLDWSIVISALTLALFLSGVYFLVLYTTKKMVLAGIISLVSIVPVISLGLSSWGMLATGFVPKEISVCISVWLTILYLYGISTGSKTRITLFFLLLGLFANFYPPVFFHYALALLTAEVLRNRAIRKEHLLYGVLFLSAAPLALFDIFITSSHFTPPDLSIIIDRYDTTLHSLRYLLLQYLRKQIIYGLLVGALWFIYRRILKREYSACLSVWYAIWWTTLLWSLVGVGVEVFAPLYMKYLLSRISVWFYLASMIIVAYSAYEIWFAKVFHHSVRNTVWFSLLLFPVLLSQTSILNVYNGIRDSKRDAEDYKAYLSVVTKLKDIVPPGSLVLANPDAGANTIRTYGGVGVYVAAKDGTVLLFDGSASQAWFKRYKEVQEVFSQKDFSALQKFATAHELQFYLFNKKDIQRGADALKKMTILESGNYGLATFSRSNKI